MKKLSFGKLMAFNPTLLDTMINQIGQRVNFYEHPTKGDEYTVLGVFPDFNIAFDTDHWDTSDFYDYSDYNPIYKDGRVFSAFEVNLK